MFKFVTAFKVYFMRRTDKTVVQVEAQNRFLVIMYILRIDHIVIM